MARSGPEAKFTAEMNKSFEELDCAFYHRIEDDAFNAATTHTRKKPFDALAISTTHSTRAYALEYKAVNKIERWNLSNLKPHQVEGLLKAKKNGMLSWVVINFRQLQGKQKMRSFAIPLYEYLNFKMIGRKSITIGDLENHSCYSLELPRIKLTDSYGWDVNLLTKTHF